MAASNTVDIEVNLKGASAAKKGLNSIGESAGQIAQKFDQTNSHLGEGLSSLTGNVEEMVGSFGELGGAITQAGKAGKAGFLLMLPAIGGVVAAGYALYETFNMITGASQRAEDAQEAMAAAAGDLQSKLEALAEKGVIPTTQELYKFTQANIAAQIAKENLQKTIEKTTKTEQQSRELSVKVAELEKEKAKLQQRANEIKKDGDFLTARSMDLMAAQLILDEKLSSAKAKQAQAEHDYATALRNILPLQEEAQKKIKASAELEKQLEDRSAESTLGRVKELAARLQVLDVAEAETVLEGNALELQKERINQENQLLAIQLERQKRNADELASIEKRLKDQIAGYNQEAIIVQNSEAKQAAIRKKAEEERAAERKRRYDSFKAMQQKRAAEEYQIRSLEIEQMRLQGASIEEVMQARYEAEIKLAGKNAQRKLAIDLRYENERLRIQQAADQQAERQAEQEQRRAEQEQRRAEQERQRLEAHRRQFLYESQAFDISMMKEGSNKELSLLELKYRQEFEMKERSEEELTELTRRYNIERAAIIKRYTDEGNVAFKESMMSMVDQLPQLLGTSIFQHFTDASADEARENLHERYQEDVKRAKKAASKVEGTYKQRVDAVKKANEQINEMTLLYQQEREKIAEQEKSELPRAIGNLLLALGQQALIESLMMTAKGIAAAYIEPQAAAGYFAGAGVMAGAAIAAGVAGSSLAGSGGGGGGGAAAAASVSPLGSPQEAPEVEREQARDTQMVFNINFGGAVIYDTKASAEQALADRITNLQNTPRRGAPRRRF